MPKTPPLSEITTISSFLARCDGIAANWNIPSQELWYRGQANAEWQLLPGLFRFADLVEDELRSEFVLKGRELLPHLPNTDWEWYFLMQHYGLPTRLLDWTAGSLIALHFALALNQGTNDAAVWLLNPKALNQLAYKHSELVVTGSEFAPDDFP